MHGVACCGVSVRRHKWRRTAPDGRAPPPAHAVWLLTHYLAKIEIVGLLYFDTHATSYPKPEAVQRAVAQALAAPPPPRSQASRLFDDTRQALLRFFGAANGEALLFTSGSTEGLNLVIGGLPLRQGAQIVSTVTEHNSVLRPLHALSQRSGIAYRLARCCPRGYVDLEQLRRLCAEGDTLALVVNHASNVTGAVQPLAEIANIAQATGAVLIVDASQSAGAVPISLKDTPVDALVGTAHKNLLAATGLGFVVLSQRFRPAPLKVGGTGSRSELLTQPDTLPLRYEAGTPNYVGIAALAAGVAYIEQIGIASIQAAKRRHYERVAAALRDMPNWQIFAPDTEIPTLNLHLPPLAPSDVAYMLAEIYDVQARAGLHCAPLIHEFLGTRTQGGTLRLGFAHTQTDEEVQQLIDALAALAAGM